ncbi:hypothetical protein D3C81_1487010 [compost metagenome]
MARRPRLGTVAACHAEQQADFHRLEAVGAADKVVRRQRRLHRHVSAGIHALVAVERVDVAGFVRRVHAEVQARARRARHLARRHRGAEGEAAPVGREVLHRVVEARAIGDMPGALRCRGAEQVEWRHRAVEQERVEPQQRIERWRVLAAQAEFAPAVGQSHVRLPPEQAVVAEELGAVVDIEA